MRTMKLDNVSNEKCEVSIVTYRQVFFYLGYYPFFFSLRPLILFSYGFSFYYIKFHEIDSEQTPSETIPIEPISLFVMESDVSGDFQTLTSKLSHQNDLTRIS